MFKKFKGRFALLVLPLCFVLGVAYMGIGSNATAGPEIIGNPDGASGRLLINDGGTGYKKIVYFATGSRTMSTASTPIPSGMFCGLGDAELFNAEIRVAGTLTGTAPTLAFKWQNSYDGGKNWNDVGTWTTVNATTTPATQNQVVADLQAATAVAFGDCWRATYVFGGSGTVTSNFSIVGASQ